MIELEKMGFGRGVRSHLLVAIQNIVDECWLFRRGQGAGPLDQRDVAGRKEVFA